MKPRDYQRRCTDAIYDYFRQWKGNPLVCIPTGGGKSLIIGMVCREVLQQWPGQRLLVLSHVKELIQQNYDKIRTYWPGAPAGIYSASLGMRQPRHPVVVATIQSVHKKAHMLGHRDLVLIDECHLVNAADSGMYRNLLNDLRAINPRLKVIGLSATPYRLDSGLLHEGDERIFTDVAFELPIEELLDGGYLTRLISKASAIQADLSRVGLVGGEFNSKQMEAAFDQDAFTSAVLNEVLRLTVGRKAMLFFCTGVEHAEHVTAGLRARGVRAETVTGKTPHLERDRILKGFRAGQVPALASVNVVSTGFDAPNVDCLVLLRATMSPGLFVQMTGRGLRPVYAAAFDLNTQEGRLAAIAAGPKPNCLVLDYGSNITRHGPVTHITPPGKRHAKKKGEDEEPKVKICELCRTAWPLGTVECAECGNLMVKERDMLKKLEARASDADVMMSHEEWLAKNTAWVEVDGVSYHRHRKEGSPDSMRVEYKCGMMRYAEWICLDHPNFAGKKARKWWNERSPAEHKIPADVKYDLSVLTQHGLNYSDQLTTPSRIRVQKDGKFFKILDHDFTGEQYAFDASRNESTPQSVEQGA